jgi:hypothetical protein
MVVINFVPLDRNEAAPQPKVSFLDMKHAGQWVAPLAAGLTGLPVDHIMSCYYRCGPATVAPPVHTRAFDDGDPAAAAVSISVLTMRASGHHAGPGHVQRAEVAALCATSREREEGDGGDGDSAEPTASIGGGWERRCCLRRRRVRSGVRVDDFFPFLRCGRAAGAGWSAPEDARV